VFGLSLWSQPRTDPKSEVTQWQHIVGVHAKPRISRLPCNNKFYRNDKKNVLPSLLYTFKRWFPTTNFEINYKYQCANDH